MTCVTSFYVLLLLRAPLLLSAGESFSGLAGDKTLVVWVTPSNTTQRGGSALTIDDRKSHFDGIVFGELAPTKWMAGSDFHRRSSPASEKSPAEPAQQNSLVQIAIVYRGTSVTVFRNGVVYSAHQIKQPQSFGKDSAILFGPRHLDAQDGACFAGSIDDARIYGFALSADQVGNLVPNKIDRDEPQPTAWWHFETGTPEDAMKAFPAGKLGGSAKITSGRLILTGDEDYLITPPAAAPKPPTLGPDTPDEFILDYHLMHPGGASMPGDPNAAFCLDGVYHLHYILAHPWRGQTSFSFVHVTSLDMLHWTWQATKLQPAFTDHGMFSGTGFITKEGKPAAIYHGQASGKNQIALAADRKLTAWEKPFPVDVNTVAGKPAAMSHWDPDCFLIGDTYYAISGGANPPVFKSKDLKRWTLVGDFVCKQPSDVVIGEDISCPNFFKLGNKWVLLCISHSLGCRYYIGDWDEKSEQFVPTSHGRMNFPRIDQPNWGLFNRTDFFAPESVLTPDGRRVMWAWITSAGPGNKLLNKTIQSLPRELNLPNDGILRIKPLSELEGQRYDPVVVENLKLAHPVTGHADAVPPKSAPQLHRIANLTSEAQELRLAISNADARRRIFGVVLFSDGKGGGLPIVLLPELGMLQVGNIRAPFAVSDLPESETIELRIFIDKYMVEVFANDRQAVVAAHFDRAGKSAIDAFTVGTPTTFKKLEMWKIKPTNQGFFEARKNRHWEPRMNR